MRRKEARDGASGTSFADALAQEAAAPQAPARAAAPEGVGALIGLQEVEADSARRARSLAHGRDLLDQLEEIRHGLLMGTLSSERLRGMLALVRGRRETDADPRIQALLEEIELRARVELAKLGLPA